MIALLAVLFAIRILEIRSKSEIAATEKAWKIVKQTLLWGGTASHWLSS